MDVQTDCLAPGLGFKTCDMDFADTSEHFAGPFRRFFLRTFKACFGVLTHVTWTLHFAKFVAVFFVALPLPATIFAMMSSVFGRDMVTSTSGASSLGRSKVRVAWLPGFLELVPGHTRRMRP